MRISSVALAGASAAAILSGSALAADLPPRGPAVAPAPLSFSRAHVVGLLCRRSGRLDVGRRRGEGDRQLLRRRHDRCGRRAPTTRCARARQPIVQQQRRHGRLDRRLELPDGLGGARRRRRLLLLGNGRQQADGRPLRLQSSRIRRRRSSTNYPVSTTSSSSMDWFATLRARAGFLVTPATLLYATGGLAFADVSASMQVAGSYYSADPAGQVAWVSSASGGETKTGWTLGAGVEHKFSRNWSLKLEYLYYDLGDVTVRNDMSARARPAASSRRTDRGVEGQQVRFRGQRLPRRRQLPVLRTALGRKKPGHSRRAFSLP